ncbi:hypothetical protein HW132_00365 [Brasilonema sp. CT11]|nr:hypothetical protein [Brasilonema sp. CT11]
MSTRVESDQMYFSCKEIHSIIHNYKELLPQHNWDKKWSNAWMHCIDDNFVVMTVYTTKAAEPL